jgi:Icc-related predicted phosphoesterase
MASVVDHAKNGSIVRVAAVGDLHCTRTSHGALQQLFTQVSGAAQMLLLAGDLTDTGLPDEARVLARELSALHVPGVAVFGNHDHESGKQDEIREILTAAGLTVLDGDTCEIQGVGIAGVKGFAGGFGKHALGSWGEEVIKVFVREAVNEALKLEAALARLQSEQRIVLLHYSPIQQTVEGEPVEVYPFVGSSRLEEPIGRFPVTAVFHAHAHHGRPEGVTKDHVPVYNVSMPLLARTYPEQARFRIIEIPVDQPAPEPVEGRR